MIKYTERKRDSNTQPEKCDPAHSPKLNSHTMNWIGHTATRYTVLRAHTHTHIARLLRYSLWRNILTVSFSLYLFENPCSRYGYEFYDCRAVVAWCTLSTKYRRFETTPRIERQGPGQRTRVQQFGWYGKTKKKNCKNSWNMITTSEAATSVSNVCDRLSNSAR